MQITSLEIVTPRLSSTLSNRLTSGLNSLPYLHTVTITNPSLVESLPHPQSVRCLKLHYLPEHTDSWQWLALIQNLQELDVSFREKIHKSIHGERLHISITNVESTGMSTNGTGRILSNLPRTLSGKVINCKAYVRSV